MKAPVPHQTRKSAFTLVEVLVTIAIIIVLAALAFSGFSKMRSAGDRIGAISSLSQIQMANTTYATEHNGTFVPVELFDDKGSSYVAWYECSEFLGYLTGEEPGKLPDGKADTTVPANLLDPVTVRARKLKYDIMSASFGYLTTGLPNRNWGSPHSAAAFRSSQLTAPERSAIFFTATDWNVHHGSRFRWKGDQAVEGASKDQKIAYRHKGKAIVAYYDGHVGEVSMDDIRRIDTQGGANHIFWRADAK